MKKYKKTYAILHLAEKHTTFHLGKTKVHVSFTGGQVTKKGVTPATFTTSDPIIQLAIENSPDFSKGAITIQSQYPAEGKVSIGRNSHDGVKTAETIHDAIIQEQDGTTDGDSAEAPETDRETETETEVSDNDKDNDREVDGGLTAVEVSCKDVAKQYLQDHYDERPAPLRTWTDVQACAAKYGIIFKSPALE